MRALKITVITCAAISVAFLTAFFCVLGVFLSANENVNRKYDAYVSQSAIVGEITVEYDGKCWRENSVYVDGAQLKTFKNGNASKVFEYGKKTYALALCGQSGALCGYLYEYCDGDSVFIEKLAFSKVST